jgi:hypothetical protein
MNNNFTKGGEKERSKHMPNLNSYKLIVKNESTEAAHATLKKEEASAQPKSTPYTHNTSITNNMNIIVVGSKTFKIKTSSNSPPELIPEMEICIQEKGSEQNTKSKSEAFNSVNSGNSGNSVKKNSSQGKNMVASEYDDGDKMCLRTESAVGHKRSISDCFGKCVKKKDKTGIKKGKPHGFGSSKIEVNSGPNQEWPAVHIEEAETELNRAGKTYHKSLSVEYSGKRSKGKSIERKVENRQTAASGGDPPTSATASGLAKANGQSKEGSIETKGSQERVPTAAAKKPSVNPSPPKHKTAK